MQLDKTQNPRRCRIYSDIKLLLPIYTCLMLLQSMWPPFPKQKLNSPLPLGQFCHVTSEVVPVRGFCGGQVYAKSVWIDNVIFCRQTQHLNYFLTIGAWGCLSISHHSWLSAGCIELGQKSPPPSLSQELTWIPKQEKTPLWYKTSTWVKSNINSWLFLMIVW